MTIICIVLGLYSVHCIKFDEPTTYCAGDRQVYICACAVLQLQCRTVATVLRKVLRSRDVSLWDITAGCKQIHSFTDSQTLINCSYRRQNRRILPTGGPAAAALEEKVDRLYSVDI